MKVQGRDGKKRIYSIALPEAAPFTDVKINLKEGKTANAHKIFLHLNPIFSEVEAKEDIDLDLTMGAWTWFKVYNYLGCKYRWYTDHDIAVLLELLDMATKFQMPDLVNECAYQLSTRVNPGNCTKVLTAAMNNKATALETYCRWTIASNLYEFHAREDFLALPSNVRDEIANIIPGMMDYVHRKEEHDKYCARMIAKKDGNCSIQ